ncbi:NAD(P)-binding protein [Armillaria solidipes]|uniref:NAD(P)-binding protein n=1 Tax=Armillaria solidipes TaxID=1076256 RepID=A0A2H3AIB3_9AGAR|nr:NAD(P)-binding protein [Armillaria solidipes]
MRDAVNLGISKIITNTDRKFHSDFFAINDNIKTRDYSLLHLSTMTEPLRLGIIGLSTKGWASTHLVPPLLAPPLSSQYKLLAVSTTNPTSAEASAAKYSTTNTTVKAYHTPESIATDPDLDIVAVSVKTPNHVENATKVIEAGKDLFIEWPAGRGLKETKLFAELAREKGIRTIVGLQARQSALFRKVKNLVEEGKIGDVLSTSMTSRIPGPHAPWGPTVLTGSEYLLKKDNGATLLDIPEATFSKPSRIFLDQSIPYPQPQSSSTLHPK